MSNNTVDLSGYLVIQHVDRISSGYQTLNRIKGWIHTDTAAFGGHHPFIAAGKPADIILEKAREYALDFRSLDQKVGVTARGKLFSGAEKSFFDVKNIYFFDTSNPIADEQHFMSNVVKLQGHLATFEQTTLTIGEHQVISSRSLLATDKACFGGHHPVLLDGPLAKKVILAMTKKTIPATIAGKLLSLRRDIYVQAEYISLGQNGHSKEFRRE